MAKPIFLVALPSYESFKTVEDIQKKIEGHLIDYHVLVYMHNKEDLEFHALYEKDFDEVKFEELKQIVRYDRAATSNEN